MAIHTTIQSDRLIERREKRWKALLRETGADRIIGEVRAQLLLWRSGRGVNSIVIDTKAHICSTPLVLAEAIWRLNEDFDAIMSIEGARVNVPAPVPPSLGRTIRPGIDTAGLFLWDGFVDAQQDTWNGLLWDCRIQERPYPTPLIKDSAELRSAISFRSEQLAQGRSPRSNP